MRSSNIPLDGPVVLLVVRSLSLIGFSVICEEIIYLKNEAKGESHEAVKPALCAALRLFIRLYRPQLPHGSRHPAPDPVAPIIRGSTAAENYNWLFAVMTERPQG